MNTDIKTDREAGSAEVQHAYPEQELTSRILAAAFTVHNSLGAGFLERVYDNALALELHREGLLCFQEAALRVTDPGAIVGDYCADIADRALIELKACAALDRNSAQIMNYLRASGLRVGSLLNFGRPNLERRRFAH